MQSKASIDKDNWFMCKIFDLKLESKAIIL
jgi:hypothetical protein